MSSLSQKFYGKRGESNTEQDREIRLKNLKKEQYGVTYKTTRFFINRTQADAFFNYILKDAELVQKNPVTGKRVAIKKK